MNTKQIIIVRKDLKNTQGHKVRTGKLVAQGAHAAMGAVKSMMSEKIFNNYLNRNLHTEHTLIIESGSVLEDWWEGRFTKITLGCDSEQELIDLIEKAKAAKLPICLVTDAGLTEFGGIPTVTCGAIGPGLSEEIDKITGHLKPL